MKRKTLVLIGALSGLGVIGFLVLRSRKQFTYKIEPIPESMKSDMKGVSWHSECPVSLEELVLVKADYLTLSGLPAKGELIVNKSQAEKVVAALKELYEMRFPLERMDRIIKYDGEDPKSMAANNTSAFRCSPLERERFHSRGTWSEHASGDAIDINPLYNPYVKGDVVQPPEGRPYVDRSKSHPYMVTPSVVSAFAKQGWKWGGDWKSLKDWQHFSAGGR